MAEYIKHQCLNGISPSTTKKFDFFFWWDYLFNNLFLLNRMLLWQVSFESLFVYAAYAYEQKFLGSRLE